MRMGTLPHLLTVALPAASSGFAHDLVIANGRVMNPAAQLDAGCHIGIAGGKISAISGLV